MAFVDLNDFLARARLRLDPITGEERLAEGGDIEFLDADGIAGIRRAAVLVPIIPRAGGPAVLLTHRPDTMPTHPGQVAFPGGKVEPGESVFNALVREFREELGLEIIRAEPAFVVRHCYPDRSVELNVWRVIDCRGEATGREGQVVCWVAPPELARLDFLEGNQTIVERIISEVGS